MWGFLLGNPIQFSSTGRGATEVCSTSCKGRAGMKEGICSLIFRLHCAGISIGKLAMIGYDWLLFKVAAFLRVFHTPLAGMSYCSDNTEQELNKMYNLEKQWPPAFQQQFSCKSHKLIIYMLYTGNLIRNIIHILSTKSVLASSIVCQADTFILEFLCWTFYSFLLSGSIPFKRPPNFQFFLV